VDGSKNSFNLAWISAIEQTGGHDWYEPLRRRKTENKFCRIEHDLAASVLASLQNNEGKTVRRISEGIPTRWNIKA
jgi:hypothetical protein